MGGLCFNQEDEEELEEEGKGKDGETTKEQESLV